MRERSIAVLGDTHNAWLTAVCLSTLGHKVTLVAGAPPDVVVREPEFIALWKAHPIVQVDPQWHLFDSPGGLTEDRFRLKDKCLGFDFAWLAVDTPLDAAGAPSVSSMDRLVAAARYLSDQLVVSSQVPIGFCDNHVVLGSMLFQEEKALRSVAYVPENMRIGDGVRTFLNPDRIVVGATSIIYAEEVVNLLAKIPSQVPRILTTLATAEMIKHATNAFLATSISFANEIASLGKPFSVSMDTVTRALRADSRIGPKAYVEAGRPFTGGTLKRDLRALQAIQRTERPRPLVDAVLAVNERMEEPSR